MSKGSVVGWTLFLCVMMAPVLAMFSMFTKKEEPTQMTDVHVVDREGNIIVSSIVQAGQVTKLEVSTPVNCPDWSDKVSDSLNFIEDESGRITVSAGMGVGEYTDPVDMSEDETPNALYRVRIDDVRMLQTPKGPRWFTEMTRLSDGSFLNGEFRKPVKQGVEACVGLGMDDGLEGVYPCGQGER